MIGGGAVVDADGNGGTLLGDIPTGEMNSDGSFPTGSLARRRGAGHAPARTCSPWAPAAAAAFVGIAGAVSVEVIDSDTLAHIIGGAEVNQNTASSANAQQSVNVSAVNRLDVLSIDGSLGVGLGGVGASVDVGIIRNDTTAVIGGTGTKVRAKDDGGRQRAVAARPEQQHHLRRRRRRSAWPAASASTRSAATSAATTPRPPTTGTAEEPQRARRQTTAATRQRRHPRSRAPSAGLWAASRTTTPAALPSFGPGGGQHGHRHDQPRRRPDKLEDRRHGRLRRTAAAPASAGWWTARPTSSSSPAPTRLKLAATYNDAVDGTAVNLTTAGTGSNHQLLAGSGRHRQRRPQHRGEPARPRAR